MSMDAAAKFAVEVLASEALQAKVAAATNGKQGRSVAEAVAAIGQAEGFSFSADEAAAIGRQASLLLKQQSGAELSDAELAQVAGGGLLGDVQQGFVSAFSRLDKPVGGIASATRDIGFAFVGAAGNVASPGRGIVSAANQVASFFSSW